MIQCSKMVIFYRTEAGLKSKQGQILPAVQWCYQTSGDVAEKLVTHTETRRGRQPRDKTTYIARQPLLKMPHSQSALAMGLSLFLRLPSKSANSCRTESCKTKQIGQNFARSPWVLRDVILLCATLLNFFLHIDFDL